MSFSSISTLTLIFFLMFLNPFLFWVSDSKCFSLFVRYISRCFLKTCDVVCGLGFGLLFHARFWRENFQGLKCFHLRFLSSFSGSVVWRLSSSARGHFAGGFARPEELSSVGQ